MLFVIFIIGALSLICNVYCWLDIKSGRPHITSLRQITNIMDRHILNLLFGNPEPGYYYPMTQEKLRIFERSWSRNFQREVAADLICMLGAYRYLTGVASDSTLVWFIALAGICQAINILHSIALIRKWGHQIREELDDTED